MSFYEICHSTACHFANSINHLLDGATKQRNIVQVGYGLCSDWTICQLFAELFATLYFSLNTA